MKKLLISCFVFISLLLIGCGDNSIKELSDVINFTIDTNTPSTIREDSESTNFKTEVIAKAKVYIQDSYKIGSVHYDKYGYILPKGSAGFEGQGDAFGWTMKALSNMCKIQKAYEDGKLTDSAFDMSSDISTTWNNMLLNSFDGGRPFRHPDDLTGSSISRDHMGYFIELGAVAKQVNCTQITATYGAKFTEYIQYGIDHNWEYGAEGRTAPATTKMTSRHTMLVINNLYNLGFTKDDLDYSSSLHNISIAASLSDFEYSNKFLCQQGYSGACLRIGNVGVYGLMLNFTGLQVLYIDNKLNSDPIYIKSDLDIIAANFGKTGDKMSLPLGGYEERFPNWMFLTGYRFWNESSPTYNDIWRHLEEDWPETLPRENLGVYDGTIQMCTDNVIQRVVPENCNLNDDTEYVGNDYLQIFAYTILGED